MPIGGFPAVCYAKKRAFVHLQHVSKIGPAFFPKNIPDKRLASPLTNFLVCDFLLSLNLKDTSKAVIMNSLNEIFILQT